jgi:hypothetical protein
VQLSGQSTLRKEGMDVVLRTIGRAGIANDPTRDIRGDRRQTALKIGQLVLDDHIQAEIFVH